MKKLILGLTLLASTSSFASERVSVTGTCYSEKGGAIQKLLFGNSQEKTCLDIAELTAEGKLLYGTEKSVFGQDPICATPITNIETVSLGCEVEGTQMACTVEIFGDCS